VAHTEAMSIDTVIIPVDFSEVSLAAVDQGAWLAARAGTTVELVSVTTARYANVTESALVSLARDTESTLGDVPTIGQRVITTDDDDVEGTLVAEVLSRPKALWVVGSHGRTALGELLFGSVSADLVRDAEVPIVVVGRHATARPDADVLAVALDGSPLSETILPAALDMAGQLGLHLRLLQVGIDHVPNDSNDTAYLSRLSETLPHPERADFDTLYGDADEELVSYVERAEDVAMLAMATHGVPAGSRISVPSTAMRVLRHSTVPLLMLHPAAPQPTFQESVREGLEDTRNRVVVGVDTYAASAPAVEWAAAEAERMGAILQVIHTWSIPVGAASMYGYPIWPDIDACRAQALEEVAETGAAIAATHPGLLVETLVAEGNPAQVIAEQSRGAKLVVLGRHHHGRIAKILVGSTSQAALHHVTSPIVIVPCDEDDLG
jgi:nucleotide-binding universal stress UspA family protein